MHDEEKRAKNHPKTKHYVSSLPIAIDKAKHDITTEKTENKRELFQYRAFFERHGSLQVSDTKNKFHILSLIGQ